MIQIPFELQQLPGCLFDRTSRKKGEHSEGRISSQNVRFFQSDAGLYETSSKRNARLNLEMKDGYAREGETHAFRPKYGFSLKKEYMPLWHPFPSSSVWKERTDQWRIIGHFSSQNCPQTERRRTMKNGRNSTLRYRFSILVYLSNVREDCLLRAPEFTPPIFR